MRCVRPLLTAVFLTATLCAADPAVTAVTPDTGASSADGFTSATTLTITGTCDSGALVEILADASEPPTTVVGTATVTGGTWTFTWTSGIVSPGVRNLRPRSTLGVDTNLAPSSTRLFIDPLADAPAITAISAPVGALAGWTNEPRPTISGTANPGSSVTVLADGTPVATATADAAGAWSALSTRDLTSGLHVITATQTDLAGNGESAASATVPLHVDYVLSEIVIYSATTGTTNDNTPGYAGKAEVGATVELHTGSASGPVIGTVTADADGLWSLAPGGAQADGGYTYYVSARDAAGNSKSAGPFAVTIDTVVAGALAVTDFITEPGPTADGGTTADRTVTVRGTLTGAEAGVTVALTVNGRSIGNAVISGTDWTAAIPTTLNDAMYLVNAQARDPAGNSTALVGAAFIVDGPVEAEEYKPQLDGEISGGLTLVTSDTTPTITGLARPSSVLTVNQSPGSAAPATVTATGTGTFAFTPSSPLADGTYTYTFANADGTSEVYTVTVDSQAPGAATAITVSDDTGSSATDRRTYDDRLVVSALGFSDPAPAAAPLTATLRLDGSVVATAAVDGSGRADFDLTGRVLPDGTYTAQVTAADAAGNSGSAFSATFTVDRYTDPPLITGITPDTGRSGSDGVAQIGGLTVLTGRAEPGASVELTFSDGSTTQVLTAIANGSGVFTTAIGELLGLGLADGSWTVTPVATDVAGNTNLASHHPDLAGSRPSSGFGLVKDTTAPAVDAHISEDRGSSASDNLTSDDRLVVSGSTEALAQVVVHVTQGSVTYTRTVLADAGGAYSADFSDQPLAEGAWTLSAQATDLAGNAGAVDTQTVTIDTTPPAVAISPTISVDTTGTLDGLTVGTVTDRITSDTDVLVDGTMELGASVVLRVDGATVGAVSASGTSWLRQTGVMAASGSAHQIVARATDAAGNTADSAALAVTVDTAMATPSVSTVTPSQGFVGGGAVGGVWTTNATTVAIRASGENGSALRLSYKLSSSGTWTDLAPAVATGSSATWSGLDLSALAPAGATTSFDLRVDGVDHAGNASASGTSTLVIDRVVPGTVPTITQVADDTTPFTGAPWNGAPYSTDRYTRDNRVVVSGTGADAAGGYVRVYVNGVARGWVATPAGGNWSLNLGAAPFNVVVPDGNLTFTATNGDLAGNEGAASAGYAMTVDTRKPVAAITGMTTADTGRSATDRITQTAQPAFAGEVVDAAGTDDADVPLLSFTLKRGSTVVEALTVASTETGGSASDTWTYTTPAAQPDGTYSFEVVGRDLAGNASAMVAIGFTIDRAAAVPGGLKLTTATDSGESHTDLLTNVRRPTVTGNAVETHAYLRIYRDTVAGQQIGTATAAANGTWTVALSADLAEGANVLAVTQEDIAGNVSAPAFLTVTLDTIAPASATVTGLTPATDSGVSDSDGLTNHADPVTQGGCPNDADSLLLTAVGPGRTAINLTVDLTLGVTAWSQVLTALPEGVWSVTAIAVDRAGNQAVVSSAYLVTVDRTPPQIAIAGLEAASDSGVSGDNLTAMTMPTLDGTIGTDAVAMTLDVTGIGSVVPVRSGGAWSWTSATPLADGPYPSSATATDAAGNVSAAATLTFAIDTLAPSKPSIDAITTDSGTAGDFVTNDNTLVFSGSAEAQAVVGLFHDGDLIGVAVADGSGHFTIDLTASPIPNGTYPDITCVAIDAAGNTSVPSDPRTLVVDDGAGLGPPLISSVSLDSGVAGDWVTNDNTPLISGRAKVDATVTLSIGSTVLGSAVVNSRGRWSLQISTPLADQTATLSATQRDLAGNDGSGPDTQVITIDTVIAAPAVSAVSSDTGRSATDRITNDTTLTVSGTAEALSTVSVHSNGTDIGNATANASGAWSLAWTFSEGVHDLTASAQDLAGNAATSPAVALTVDLTAPPAPVISGWSDDTGAAGDGITADKTPTLSGFAEALAIVTVRDGATVLGTVTAAADGSWSYTLPSRFDGSHAITASATDIAGNTGAWSATTTITVDTATVAPQVTAISPDTGRSASDRITKAATLTVQGTAEAGSAVTLRNGTTVLGSAVADATGVWTVDTTPAAGVLALRASAVDPAGNAAGPGTALAVTVDRTAPGVPTLVLPSSPTNDTQPTVSGVAEPDAQVDVLVGAVVVVSVRADAATGAWSWTPSAPLPDATYSIRVRATDVAGNVGTPSAAQSLEIDTDAPAVGILGIDPDTGDPSDGVTSSTRPLLVGVTSPDTYVEITLGAATSYAWSDAIGIWTLQLPDDGTSDLVDGSYDFTAIAYDAAGNASLPSSYTVVVDTAAPSAPAITLVQPSTGSLPTLTTTSALPLIGGAAGSAEADATLSLRIDGSEVGTATVAPDGSWSVQLTVALAKGWHTCVATATDLAGNASADSALVSLLVNLPPPPPVITAMTPDTGIAGDLITADPRPVFQGTSEEGSTVTVTLRRGGVVEAVFTALTDSNGQWSGQPAVGLTDASYVAEPVAEDIYGNIRAGAPFAFVIDAVSDLPLTRVVILAGEVSANVVRVSIDGHAAIPVDGRYRLEIPVPPGITELPIELRDANGRTTTGRVAVGLIPGANQ